jgi:hypothetical protein
MQDNSYWSPEQAHNEHARLTISGGKTSPHRGVVRSVGGALLLLAWDVVLFGSLGLSFFVCPIWFLFSIVKNSIQRPGWIVAIIRIAIPALTLGLVLANFAVQLKIAKANAPRIVAACEEFHAANGKFPKTLGELVPRYIPSIPRAKYCLTYGEFYYWNWEGHPPLLIWYTFPVFGKNVYNFENRQWNYID